MCNSILTIISVVIDVIVVVGAAVGLFILPMLPAVLENCDEITYPIPEELSVGILFVGTFADILVKTVNAWFLIR